MQTRPYSTLYALIEALCGVQFAPVERPRIKALVNSRAKRAYDSCDYWPRWIKLGEERQIQSGVIPYTELNLTTIGEFIRIFLNAPYGLTGSQEYDFSVTSDGAKLVSGILNPTSAFVNYHIQFDTEYGDGTLGENTLIPNEWLQYLAHGTYADFLRSEGQQEKAVIADQEAEEKLTYELIKPEIVRMSQLVGNKVSTNASMQSRYSGGYWR